MSPVYADDLVDNLPDGWSVHPFEELVYFQEGPGIRNWQYVSDGIPFVNIRCLVDGRLDRQAMSHVSKEEAFGKYRHFLLDADDYVVSSSGTLGRVATVQESDIPCMLNTSVIRMRPKTGELDRGYLKYFLLSDLYQTQIVSLATGSAQLNYGPMHLRQMFIVRPPLQEQRAIAHTLGTLDNKIELNRRMVKTLEETARALFKSWFVDFDPVRAKAEGRDPGLPPHLADLFPDSLEESELGEIPRGWEVKAVEALADIAGGTTPNTKEPAYWEGGSHAWATPKDLSGLAVPVLLETERKITDAGLAQVGSGLLPPGTVLLSSRAPIGYLAITELPIAINQGFIAMLARPGVSNLFLLLWAGAVHEEILSRANGSTFLEISKTNFRPIQIVTPPPDVMKAFEMQTRPLYRRIVGCVKESRTLASARDTLLPKLISGELKPTRTEQLTSGDN
jgi:type I restriction enzyme S subunit